MNGPFLQLGDKREHFFLSLWEEGRRLAQGVTPPETGCKNPRNGQCLECDLEQMLLTPTHFRVQEWVPHHSTHQVCHQDCLTVQESVQ